jgi:hypothetical protein
MEAASGRVFRNAERVTHSRFCLSARMNVAQEVYPYRAGRSAWREC